MLLGITYTQAVTPDDPTRKDETESERTTRETPSGVFAEGELVADRYRVTRFIAKGGMGAVYEAEDQELGGQVALKTFRSELDIDPTILERFRREIQLAIEKGAE